MGDLAQYQKVRQFLETEKGRLSHLGIRRIGIFGSVAGGADRPKSEVQYV
jgi:predicted nucleotidyltransferase